MQSDPSSITRIWVTDFSRAVQEKDLWDLFTPFGEVKSIACVETKKGGRMAFVDMKNVFQANEAIEKLNGRLFYHQNITVKKSNAIIQSRRYIYALINFNNRECYIGETCDLKGVAVSRHLLPLLLFPSRSVS